MDEILEALDEVRSRYRLRSSQERMLEDIERAVEEGDRVVVLADRPGSGKSWLLRRIARHYDGRVLYTVPSPSLAEDVYRTFEDWDLSVEHWRRVEDYGRVCKVGTDELLSDLLTRLDPDELRVILKASGEADEHPKCYPWFYRKPREDKRRDDKERDLRPLLEIILEIGERELGRERAEELVEKVREALYEDNPFLLGFAPWDECGECDIIRSLKEPARILCMSFKKLLSAPFLYASHRRAREALGKEPFVTEEDWKGVLEGSLVVFDDSHVLPAALVVEVPGYVKVGENSLRRELDRGEELTFDQSLMWQIVDWGRDIRKVRRALETGERFREVYKRLVYELEDWIEGLKEAVKSERNASYLDAKKNLSLLNELVNRSEELGVEEWIVIRSPGRRGNKTLTFAPVVEDLDQLLGLLVGPEYVDEPALFIAAENRPTLLTLKEVGRA